MIFTKIIIFIKTLVKNVIYLGFLSLIKEHSINFVKAARLQIHVNFHENLGNEFNSKIFRGKKIKQFTYCNRHLQSKKITKKVANICKNSPYCVSNAVEIREYNTAKSILNRT
jgi:hypothetical protein